MTPATDGRTAPDTASGAVLSPWACTVEPSPSLLTEGAFWRAVAATVMACLGRLPR